MKAILETWNVFMPQWLMIMFDGDHGQGFINSLGKDMINTNHAYFQKIKMQTKFRLGLMLED